jgi:acetyltransferase-like isoleucine patch superfamily enzyme
MRCHAIIHKHPHNWVSAAPFLLWEIGTKTVVEHWVDTLYESNSRMVLWLEEVDSRILTFVNETFPLCRNTTIRIGLPAASAEFCTFLDSDGGIVIQPAQKLTNYLPAEPGAKVWFKLVRNWLTNLRDKGSNTPEVEEEILPGVFVGHHCRISGKTEFAPPCWIGSYSTIAGAKIGPYAVVGENCMISPETHVTESYVLRNTALGRNLRLDGLVAGERKILHHQTGTMTAIPDNTIIRRLKS